MGEPISECFHLCNTATVRASPLPPHQCYEISYRRLILIISMSQNQVVGPVLSGLAAWALKFSPTNWFKSWLLYLGIQTHVGTTMQPEMKPLHNVCEYLHALHVYTDEARRGEVRTVSSFAWRPSHRTSNLTLG